MKSLYSSTGLLLPSLMPAPPLRSYQSPKGDPDAEPPRPLGEIHESENLWSICTNEPPLPVSLGKLVLVRPNQIHGRSGGEWSWGRDDLTRPTDGVSLKAMAWLQNTQRVMAREVEGSIGTNRSDSDFSQLLPSQLRRGGPLRFTAPAVLPKIAYR